MFCPELSQSHILCGRTLPDICGSNLQVLVIPYSLRSSSGGPSSNAFVNPSHIQVKVHHAFRGSITLWTELHHCLYQLLLLFPPLNSSWPSSCPHLQPRPSSEHWNILMSKWQPFSLIFLQKWNCCCSTPFGLRNALSDNRLNYTIINNCINYTCCH